MKPAAKTKEPAKAADEDNWNDYPKSFVGRRFKVLVEKVAPSNTRETEDGSEVPGSHEYSRFKRHFAFTESHPQNG